MAVSRDLFLAILSMDAYNRGYGAGLADGGPDDPDGLGGLGSQIGGATVTNQNISTEAEAAGFYGIAYEIEAGERIDGLSAGETVISYRGTDSIWDDFLPTDVPIFTGDYDEEHLTLATAFYRSVSQSLAPGGGIAG